jgi:mRNA interferase RelE/StbE
MSQLSFTLTNDSLNFLGGLESKQFRQVWSKILNLTKEPRPANSEHVSGHVGCYRIPIGEFRCVYRYSNKSIEVVVVDRRNDDKVYQKLRRLN